MQPLRDSTAQIYQNLDVLVTSYQKEQNGETLSELGQIVKKNLWVLSSDKLNELKNKLIAINPKLSIIEVIDNLSSHLQPKSFADFSSVLIITFLSEISSLQELINMSKVNKRFRQLAMNPSVLVNFLNKHGRELLPKQRLHLAHLCGSSLKQLDLSDYQDLRDEDLSDLVRACPNLETLNLLECYRITDDGLALLQSLIKFKTLILPKPPIITDAGLSHLHFLAALENLNLTSCFNLTAAGLSYLHSLTALQTLNLTSCSNLTEVD